MDDKDVAGKYLFALGEWRSKSCYLVQNAHFVYFLGSGDIYYDKQGPNHNWKNLLKIALHSTHCGSCDDFMDFTVGSCCLRWMALLFCK